MRIISIDPGVNGAIALIENGSIKAVFDMPAKWIQATKKRRRRTIDSMNFVSLIMRMINDCDVFVVEVQHAITGQGLTSTFATAQNYGFIHGVLSTFNKPIVSVRASEWKSYFDLIGKGKSGSVDMINEKYDLGLLKKHDGRADAILIGMYVEHEQSSEPIKKQLVMDFKREEDEKTEV